MALSARLAAFAASLPAAPALAQEPRGGSYGHGRMWDGGWWMFLGPLWMIVVIGLLIAGVVLLACWLGGPGPGTIPGRGQGPVSGNRPLDILKERFAKGEIDKDEFEERRRRVE